MDPKLAFRYMERYSANKRRLHYTILPSSRKKVKNNIKLCFKAINRYSESNQEVIPEIIWKLKNRFSDSVEDIFKDIEGSKRLPDILNIAPRISGREMNREEYFQLNHNLRYEKWYDDLTTEDCIKFFEKGIFPFE